MMEVRERWRKVLLGSVLGVVLLRPIPAPATAQESDDQAEVDRFTGSDYTWCDAGLLADYWQEDTWEAKARIGRKIGWGDVDVLEEHLADARRQAREQPPEACAFHQSEFTLDDAERLAEFWGVSIAEAKAGVEKALFDGEAKWIRTKLADLSPATGQEPAQVFLNKGYTYCDASLVAEVWGLDTWEAKAQMGAKILEQGVGQADETLNALRFAPPEGFGCSYADEGYTYDDMVALASYWNATVEEAKAAVENKLLQGLNDSVQDALREAGS